MTNSFFEKCKQNKNYFFILFILDLDYSYLQVIFHPQILAVMSSLPVTYLLWLLFGWLGLHHVYLNRWRHAVVWFMTLGGFGIGWARDFWKIPDYVAYAEKNKDLMKLLYMKMSVIKSPDCSFIRKVGMVVLGMLTSIALCGLLPNYDSLEKRSLLGSVYQLLYIGIVIIGSSLGEEI